MSDYKIFFRFVIPSVLAFALSGVYTIVDGFFIGQSLGDIGLASIVLGYPVAAIIQALGTGIGLSGAIRYTIMQAKEVLLWLRQRKFGFWMKKVCRRNLTVWLIQVIMFQMRKRLKLQWKRIEP